MQFCTSVNSIMINRIKIENYFNISIAVMVPFWLDTFNEILDSIISVKKMYTLWLAFCLFVPLLLGLGIQYMFPRVKKRVSQISMLVSLLFIISYTIFSSALYFIIFMPNSLGEIFKVGHRLYLKWLQNGQSHTNSSTFRL